MKRFMLFVAVAVLIATGCEKSNKLPDITTTEKSVEYDLEDKLAGSLFYASSLPEYLSGAFSLRSSIVTSDASQADIIVVSSSDLASKKEMIEEAWRAGKTIVEIEPKNDLHYAFWTSIGAPAYLLPQDKGNDLLFMAYHYFECYQLQNPMLIDGYMESEVADEVEADEYEDGWNGLRNDVSSVPTPISKDAAYINTKMAAFVDWENDNHSGANGTAATDEKRDDSRSPFDGELSKYIEDGRCSQHITKSFIIGIDNFQMAKVLLSDPDLITRHSTIDLDIYVTPLYSYECNASDKSGDYYFINMTLLCRNGEMCGFYRKWHGAVVTHGYAFYSKSIEWGASLVDKDGKELTTRMNFFKTPQPTSTLNSSTYTTGFSATLNASAMLGFANEKPTGSITVGGSWTWSHSNTRTVADQSIEQGTASVTKGVYYKYKCNNQRTENEMEDAIPAIGRTDQLCEAGWCWRVYGTKDDDANEAFGLKFNLDPLYGYMYRHATWGTEGNVETLRITPIDNSIVFPIVPPDRTRHGVLEFKNVTSDYINAVKVYDASGKVVAKSDSAYGNDHIFRYQLPIGTYSVEYEISNGDTQGTKGRYRVKDIEISTAETASKTTLDGVKI